mgnify:CR=1 FL=1
MLASVFPATPIVKLCISSKGILGFGGLFVVIRRRPAGEMASSTSDIPEGREKLKRSGSLGSSDTAYVRADKIDLTSLDIQLEKQLTKTWGKANLKAQGPKEDWEIDLAKLEIRYVIAQGTYGTVYRGTYDGQDVAGICHSYQTLFFVTMYWKM